MAKARTAISLVTSSIIVIALIVGFGVYFTDSFHTISDQSTPSQQHYSYTGDINSSSPCTYTTTENSTAPSPSINGQSASRVISSIENYPEFVSLEGNHTYTFAEFGCSAWRNPSKGMMTDQSWIAFNYDNPANPIHYQCGNQTVSIPREYQIVVTLALTPTGYNLANSNFTSGLLQPFESCMNPNFNGTA